MNKYSRALCPQWVLLINIWRILIWSWARIDMEERQRFQCGESDWWPGMDYPRLMWTQPYPDMRMEALALLFLETVKVGILVHPWHPKGSSIPEILEAYACCEAFYLAEDLNISSMYIVTNCTATMNHLKGEFRGMLAVIKEIHSKRRNYTESSMKEGGKPRSSWSCEGGNYSS